MYLFYEQVRFFDNGLQTGSTFAMMKLSEKGSIDMPFHRIFIAFRNLKLSQKLIISNILVVILPVLILGTYSYNNYVEQVEIQAYRDTQAQLDQRAAQVAEKMYAVENFASNISNSFFINQFLDGTFSLEFDDLMNYTYMERYISALIASNQSLISRVRIFYTNPSIPEKLGTFCYINRVDEAFIKKHDLFSKTPRWFKEESTLLKNTGSREFQLFENNEILFIRPIYSEITMKITGFITVSVLKERLFSSLNESRASDVAFIMLDQNYGALYDPNHIYSILDKELLSRDTRKIQDGKSRIIYIEKPIKGLNASLAAHASLSGPLKQAANASLSLLLIVFFSVAVSCVAVYFIVRLLLHNMKKILKAMKVTSEGDFTKRVFIETRDEMGILADSFNHMIQNVVDLKEMVVNRERLQKEAEINALQSQINPHFIYNTLEIFKSKLEMKKEFELANSILSLGRMLRYSTRWSQESLLGDELEHLNNYVRLQQINLENQLNVFINCKPELHNCRVVKLFLQPLVENCLVHGKGGKCMLNIEVNIYRDNNLLVVEVFDDGSGVPHERLETLQTALQQTTAVSETIPGNKGRKAVSLSGIGLKNINERIKLGCGEEYGLIIESEEDVYTKVTAVMPYLPVTAKEETAHA